MNQFNRLTLTALLFSTSYSALANNVGGVYGPVVNSDDKTFQFRAAHSPSENGGNDLTVMRGHYQKAFKQNLRWRIVGQVRDVDGSYEFDNAAAELVWQFQQKGDNHWDSALRFDFRTRKGDRPENVALNWTNQWAISNRMSVTALASLSWFFGGDNAPSGTQLETRARIAYKLSSDLTLGFDSFNRFGKIGDFGSFNEQGHQIGPTLSGKLADYSFMIGYLAGVSNGARDDVARLWISRSF